MTKRKEHKIENGVEMKHCNNCDSFKPLNNFNNSKSSWDNLYRWCKDCMKDYRSKNKERMTQYNKDYWVKTGEEQTKRHKIWAKENKEHRQEYNKKYREMNYEKITANDREYNRKRRADPIYQENFKRYRREYDKIKRQTDVEFKLKQNVSRRIREILPLKTLRTNKYLGCSNFHIRNHLESQFTEGMTWDNYTTDGWHIDHRIPCSAWDLTNGFEVLCCFNWRNLQPMWGNENIKKNNKYNEEDKQKYKEMMRTILI